MQRARRRGQCFRLFGLLTRNASPKRNAPQISALSSFLTKLCIGPLHDTVSTLHYTLLIIRSSKTLSLRRDA
jgi:hypothetical protein